MDGEQQSIETLPSYSRVRYLLKLFTRKKTTKWKYLQNDIEDDEESEQLDRRRFILRNVAPDTPSKLIEYYLEGRALTPNPPTLESVSVSFKFADDVKDFDNLKKRIESKTLNHARVSIERVPAEHPESCR
ncbi:uncharacterized protein [Ptychodera flava]|uniref:uncharacterized protein n=1 Tax=Ptychodera flava TaxID=63121 RepID=UPI00396AA76B